MPKLVYDVVFELDTKSVKTLKDALNAGGGRSKRGLQQAKNDVEELDQSMRGLAVTSDRLDQGLSNVNTSSVPFANRIRGMKGSVDDMSKSVNNSNQILFSFGDAVQDGAQFSQGFAQGARAVGNNLTFAAEQIALANQKTGSIGQTFKLLGSSLLGPAGVVFAVNALVTVITLWATESDKAKKKTKELEKSLSDLGKTVQETSRLADELTARGFFSDEGRNKIVRILSDIERLENRNESLRAQNERLTASQEDQARARELLNKKYSETVKLEEDEKQELQALLSIMSTSSRTRQKANEEIENNETRIKQLNKELADLNITQSQADSIFQELNVELFNLGIEVDNVSEDLVGLNEELSISVNRFKDLQRQASLGTGFTAEDLTGEQLSQAFAVDPLGDFRTLQQAKFDIFKQTEKEMTAVRKAEADARVKTERLATNAVTSLIQAIAPQNKALAISLLAIQKGIKIAQVVTDGIQKASAATNLGLLYSATPGGQGLAAAAFSAAASIKAQTALSVAAIAAQGLAEGISISQRGGSGGGSRGRSGGISGAVGQEGITTNDIPNPRPIGAEGEERDIIINLSGDISDRSISIRAERGRKKRVSRSIALRGEQ